MDAIRRELLIARIISGTVRLHLTYSGQKVCLVVRTPTREQRYIAQEVYQQTCEDLAFEELFTEETVLAWMIDRGLWTEEDEKSLTGLASDVDQMKVKVYECAFQKQKREFVRKHLNEARAKYQVLFERRHAYDDKTVHGAANAAKVRYLIGSSLHFTDGRPVVPSHSPLDTPSLAQDWQGLVDEAVETYFLNRLDEGTFRELARTEPWRSMWAARKSESSVFGVPAVDLSDEQRHLVAWSQLYDNISEHPQHPPDDVIQDDDALDGWLIVQRRQRDKDNTERGADALLTNERIRNSDEVFIVADNPEDIAAIEKLNSPLAIARKRGRMAYLADKGLVHEQDMPDTRRYLESEFTRMQAAQPGRG